MSGGEAGCELKSVSVLHVAIESHGVGENQVSGLELVSVSVSLAFESENSGVGQLALELRMNIRQVSSARRQHTSTCFVNRRAATKRRLLVFLMSSPWSRQC